MACLTTFCFGAGGNKLSTSTVAALFSKMALTGQRIAMVDVVLPVFQHSLIYRRGRLRQRFARKVFFLALWVVMVVVDISQSPLEFEAFWGSFSKARKP